MRIVWFGILLSMLISLPAWCQANSRLFIIGIGVNKYNKPGFQALNYAKKAVTSIEDTLTTIGGNQVESSFFFSDHNDPNLRPTLTNVTNKLNEYIAQATTSDRIIFYFCGHGIEVTDSTNAQIPYLLLMETSDLKSKEMLDISSVNFFELQKKLTASKFKQKLLVIDACRDPVDISGGAKEAALLPRFEQPRNSTVTTLYSCSVGQSSHYNKETGESFFTEAVIAGLRGDAIDKKSFSITTASLGSYVKAEVIKNAARAGYTQEPSIVGASADPIIIFPVIACVPFKGNFGPIFSTMLQDYLFQLGQLRFVERGNIESYLKEVQFQNMGIVDREKAQKLGTLLSANYIIIGQSDDYVANTQKVSVRVLAVADGAIVCSDSRNVVTTDADVMDNAILNIAAKFHPQLLDRMGIKPQVKKWARLKVSSTPKEARILLDPPGQYNQIEGYYEYQLENVETQKVTVKAELDGYVFTPEMVEIRRGELRTQEIRLIDVPYLLTLNADNIAQGAKIEVLGDDGTVAYDFTTPLTNRELKLNGAQQRKVKVRITPKGCEPVLEELVCERGKTTEIVLTSDRIKLAPATLVVTASDKNATITIINEKRPASNARFTFTMEGRNDRKIMIVATSNEYKTVTEAVDLVPGEAINKHIVFTEELPGSVKLYANYTGVLLYIDGKLLPGAKLTTDEVGNQPYVLSLPTNGKTRQVRLAGQLEGEDERGEEVVATLTRGLTIEKLVLRVPKSPNPSLAVNSDPPGAQIWLNGVAQPGKLTPCNLTFDRALVGTDMKVKVEKQHYTANEVIVAISKNMNVQKVMKLEPLVYRCTVNVKTVPAGAKVIVDEKEMKVEKTPCLVELQLIGPATNIVTVKAVVDGERIQEKTIELIRNGTVPCEFSLPIKLTVEPKTEDNLPLPSAVITLVNTATKEQRTMAYGQHVMLPLGVYEITVVKEGLIPFKDKVVIDGTDKVLTPRILKNIIVLPAGVGAVTMLSLSEDGKTLACYGDGRSLQAWDVNTQKLLFTTPLPKLNVLSIAITPAGDKVAMNTSFQIDDAPQSRVLWCSGTDGTMQKVSKTFNSLYYAIALAPDGATLAGASKYHDVYHHTQATRKMGTRLDGKATAMAYTSDGTLLAGCDDAGTVKVWNAGAGTEVMTTTLASPALGLTFVTGDKQLCAVMQNGSYVVLDVATGNSTPAIRLQTGELQAAAACSRYIAYGAGEKIIVVPLRAAGR